MGLVPDIGEIKMFEGGPINTSNFADQNSIQGAIKGTLPDPAVAIKNFKKLVKVSRVDMFVPKRTTAPLDAVSYRGFPRPTITEVQDYEEDNSGGDLQVSFTVKTNNKVGYPITFTFEFTVGGDTTTEDRTLPAGFSQATFIFTALSLPPSTPWSITLLSSEFPVYSPEIIIPRSGIT